MINVYIDLVALIILYFVILGCSSLLFCSPGVLKLGGKKTKKQNFRNQLKSDADFPLVLKRKNLIMKFCNGEYTLFCMSVPVKSPQHIHG